MARTLKKRRLFTKKHEQAEDAHIILEEQTIPESEIPNTDDSVNEDIESDENFQSSEEISSENERKQGGKKRINLMDESFLEDQVKKETEESEVKSDSKFSGKKISEIQDEIKEAESDATKDLTYDDFEFVAEFLIDIVDTGIATALKFYAGDSSEKPYSLPTERKRKLVTKLTYIFVKFQYKFNIEMMFIVSLIVAYWGPIRAARQHRKENKNKQNNDNVETVDAEAEVIETQTKKSNTYRRGPRKSYK